MGPVVTALLVSWIAISLDDRNLPTRFWLSASSLCRRRLKGFCVMQAIGSENNFKFYIMITKWGWGTAEIVVAPSPALLVSNEAQMKQTLVETCQKGNTNNVSSESRIQELFWIQSIIWWVNKKYYLKQMNWIKITWN